MSGDTGADMGGYSEADVRAATALLAAVFASLGLAPGATVAFRVDPSTEATLAERAARDLGHRVVRLVDGPDRAAVAGSLGEPPPCVLVVRPGDFTWLSKAAFRAGVGWVFTLGTDRTGNLLDRAVRLRDAS